MLAHMEVCEYERETPRVDKGTAATTTMAGSIISSYSDQRGVVVGGGFEKPPEVSEFSQVLVCKKGCGLPLLFQDSSDHDCVKSLQAQVGSLQAKLTRTEHDKEKVSQRLVKREECMQERFTQLEKELKQYQEQTLKYERVTTDQRSQIKYLQRQLDCDQASEENEVKVVLERHGGALGFNIRGGTEEDDTDCGLYVSKIVENSLASQPGKLQLYDRILQIDNVNLTNASHEEAVRAFKNAGDTLDITVRRLFNPRAGNDMLTSSAVVSIGVQTDAIETSETSRTPLTCCRCSSSNRSSQEFSSPGGINSLHQREDSGVDETGEHPSDVELLNGCDSNEPLDKRKSNEEYASQFVSENGVILNKLLLNTSLACLDKRGSRVMAGGNHSQVVYGGEDNSEVYSLSNGYYSGNVSQASLENVKQGVAENENAPSFDDRNDAARTDEMDGNGGSMADDLQDYNGLNDNDQLYFDSELEYEYEEITIRMGGQKSLGMIIYSGDGEDTNSIFVKEVDPRLLVGKDGRVIEGDQILKINDLAITCLEEAVDLLSKRRNDEIRFLVARPVAELQATLLGAESDHGESPSDLQTPRFHLEAFPIGVIQEEDEDEAETIMGDKCEKDSGFGRTDESLKNDESSEQEVGDDHRHKGSPKEQHKAQMDALGKQIIHFTACASNTREQLLRDSPREKSSDEHSQRSSERERREGKSSKHASRRPSTKAPADENTPNSGHERRSTNKSHKSQKSSKNSETSPAAAPSRHKERSESKEKEKSEHRRSKKDRAKDTADSSRLTNGSRAPKDEHAPAHKQNGDQQSCNENGEMKVEWRVRRNKDGSRIFISKKMRPAKQKLLRERAQKLADERRGLTTDDETQSVYLGRYWSRDDRRKQLDKVREARRVKKVELEAVAVNGGAPKRNDVSAIIQLTQKKMACMDKTFDDFMTVDEILRQRNRLGLSNGPIFVTTV